LDSNSALINYFVGDSVLFISCIRNNDHETIVVPIDSSFKNNVLQYYKSIKKFDPAAMDSLSPDLYDRLLAPIAEKIKNKPRLIIIPDEYLYYIPFEALYSERGNPDYLIKSHSISYNHSATLWYQSNVKNLVKPIRADNLVAFAPVFSKKSNNGLILASNIQVVDTSGHNLAYRSISADRGNFNPLPASESEVTSIIKLFEKKGKEAKGFLYGEASEENLKTKARGYKYVHIATHGFSNDQSPSLSGLAFSQPTDTGIVLYDSLLLEYKVKGEDGILYAGEAYNLNLDADLVVLSSCEGGIGKLSKGEGLLSMTRGFLYSGTPNIIYSLYKVSDQHTKDLMTDFYTGILQNKSYADALRQAKLNMINNESTSNPFFWSGFVLLGR
jgi:CHAT domain-containing protein